MAHSATTGSLSKIFVATVVALIVLSGISDSSFAQHADVGSLPVRIELDLENDSPRFGETVTVRARITARAELHDVDLALSSASGIAIQGQPLHFDVLNPDSVVEVTALAALTTEGRHRITAAVTAQDPRIDQRLVHDRTLYLLVYPSAMHASDKSMITARYDSLLAAAPAGKTGSADFDRALAELVSSRAATVVNPSPSAGKAAVTLTISGTILWTDRFGNTHPVKNAEVEIVDDDDIFDDILATTTTDDAGAYSASVEQQDSDPVDVFVRVFARGGGPDVQPTGFFAGTYRSVSSTVTDLTTSAAFNLTIGNAADEENAFSVYAAVVEGFEYVSQIAGSGVPDVSVEFPNGSSGSFYCGNGIFDGDPGINCGLFGTYVAIEEDDRNDWDVIHHEFGHYVSDEFNLDQSPGGGHSLGDNLSERYDKDKGTKLAWGEAWPTYFAISLQTARNLSSLGIARVGDLFYDDFESEGLRYSIESQAGGASRGEDNELAVQRALWDLSDSASDAGDNVSLGAAAVWNALVGANPARFDQAWNAIVAGKPLSDLVDYAEILVEHSIGPELDAPADGVEVARTGDGTTFEWTANGGGPEFRSNSFTVEVYDASLTTLLFSSPDVTTSRSGGSYPNTADYTPTVDDFVDQIFKEETEVKWLVRARQTDSPTTGVYTSPARTLKAKPWTAAAYILDRSGSMSGSPLTNAKSAASQGITLMKDGDDVAVTSFSSFASTNLALRPIKEEADRQAARNAVNRLFASGSTSIGAGLLRGCAELQKSAAATLHFVLLSDGQHNFPPSPADGMACINAIGATPGKTGPMIASTASSAAGVSAELAADGEPIKRVHTIAFGTGADQALLSSLASQTGGVFLYVPTRNDPLALADLFLKIQGEITDEQRTGEVEGSIAAPEVQQTPFAFEEGVSEGKVTLIWDNASASLQLELVRPDGTVVDADNWQSTAGASRVAGPAIEYYTIAFPEAGSWTARVAASSGSANYALVFTGQSSLQMEVRFDQSEYALGENIYVLAAITDEGVPVTGADVTASVLTPTSGGLGPARAMAEVLLDDVSAAKAAADEPALVRNADGSYETAEGEVVYAAAAPLKLYDDGGHGDGAAGDGVYGNFYSGTGVEGTYTFEVAATGTSSAGAAFTRQVERATVVLPTALPSCPGTLQISGYDSDQPGSPDTQEYVELTNQGPQSASLDGCALVFYDGATSTSYFAMDLTGSVSPGASHRIGNAAAADVDETFADNTLQNGPDAIALYRASATAFPAGTDVTIEKIVASVVYIDDDNVFGASKAGDDPGLRLLTLPQAVRQAEAGGPPTEFTLQQNYPNPFNPSTKIRYSVPSSADVSLVIYDLLGREVRRLVSATLDAGHHEAVWDARDQAGRPVASGVYLYRIDAGDFAETRRMTLMR